jgi:hypothetical protein
MRNTHVRTGHRDYTQTGGFQKPERQHNIMCLVGNGFDLQVLHDYGSTTDTRYAHFYEFLERRKFDPNNLLMAEMNRLRKLVPQPADWADFENCVGTLVEKKEVSIGELRGALADIQGQFTEFLESTVPAQLLARVGLDSMEGGVALKSFSSFLGDLDDDEYRRLEFPSNVDNLDLYNFTFVNFNYTALLDGLVYLDQKQFDPHPHQHSDRNFKFNYDPRNVAPRKNFNPPCESYIISDVLHPHGTQSVPRSLLFGIDEQPGKPRPGSAHYLSKPFWAQNQARYSALFHDTELYVIFGCSLGDSDRWWWRRIVESLGRPRKRMKCRASQCGGCGYCQYTPEVILYSWHAPNTPEPDKDAERRRLFDAAGVQPTEELLSRVHVVTYTVGSERSWLNTERKP